MIKCSNCSRKPQPDDQFLDAAGRVTKSCLKCRTKGAKRTFTAEQRDRRLAQQRENKYYVTYRDKKRAENEQGFLAHNASVLRAYRQDHKVELLQWSRTNFKRRLDSIKATAVDRNLSWELTDEECKTMMVDDGTCFYCNEPDPERIIGLSLLDPKSNYSTSNTRPACYSCNRIKCNLDARTFVERCQQMLTGVIQHLAWPVHGVGSFNSYKERAIKKQLPFEINEETFHKLQSEPCFYCHGPGGGVDRRDNTQGYTVENTTAACTECNYMKRDLEEAVFLQVGRRVGSRVGLLESLPDLPRRVHAFRLQ